MAIDKLLLTLTTASSARACHAAACSVAALALASCDAGSAAYTAGSMTNRLEATVNAGASTLHEAAVAVQQQFDLGLKAAPTPKAAASPPARVHDARKRRRGPPDAPLPEPAQPLDSSAPAASPQEASEPSPPASAPEESFDGPAYQTPEVSDAPTHRVFSVADDDVTPPRLVRAQVSTPLFVNGGHAANVLEVVISEQGRVEGVRLRSEPQRLTDVQLLSNAKTWEFEPARRAGTPVRYRAVITWESTP